MFDPREIVDRAAALVEHASSVATPGPWVRHKPPGHATVTAAVPVGEEDWNHTGRVTVCVSPIQDHRRFGRRRAPRDLDWVALMDPTVGPLLAEVLRDLEVLGVVPGSAARLAAHLVGSAGSSLLAAAGVGHVLIPQPRTQNSS